MKYIVSNIHLGLDEDIDLLKEISARKLSINKNQISGIKILKESVDARRKQDISLVYSVLVNTEGTFSAGLSDDVRPLYDVAEDAIKASFVVPYSEKGILQFSGVPKGTGSDNRTALKHRPVIAGSGPAGLFAGLVLACGGYRPIIIERGENVEKRTEIVSRYWSTGELDTETNVQFGEGGAGTFSDGKLTTRINDRRCEAVLNEFYAAGAPGEILYKSKPHIGSDLLKNVVRNIRKKIIGYGGEILFKKKLTSIIINNDRICGLNINENADEYIETEALVLAIGHSARDTFYSLFSQGVEFVQKPFSIGVRIEHPQEMINRVQYGPKAGHTKLGAADYQLFCRLGDRTAYTFCMCPGGVVTASASEQGMIVTNGMSEYSRDGENANSAFVVSVGPGDFDNNHPLAGIEFQRRWERAAYVAGGSNGAAPVQKLGDFMNAAHRETHDIMQYRTQRGSCSGGSVLVKPGYTGRTCFADINHCLPAFVTNTLKDSVAYFDRKLPGFGMKDALLTGVETRTSSPVRMTRTETFEAEGIRGLYPAGEGAGYAGGIVSAAVDGMKVAEQIIKIYSQPG